MIPSNLRVHLALEPVSLHESIDGLCAEIRRQEELPVYERLGDVRGKAVTKGQIADVLLAHGQLDEVLRFRREEQLPVDERLGDRRELLVAQTNGLMPRHR